MMANRKKSVDFLMSSGRITFVVCMEASVHSMADRAIMAATQQCHHTVAPELRKLLPS